jgi:hypothetical protein
METAQLPNLIGSRLRVRCVSSLFSACSSWSEAGRLFLPFAPTFSLRSGVGASARSFFAHSQVPPHPPSPPRYTGTPARPLLRARARQDGQAVGETHAVRAPEAIRGERLTPPFPPLHLPRHCSPVRPQVPDDWWDLAPHRYSAAPLYSHAVAGKPMPPPPLGIDPQPPLY